jgi:hypothetical protein
MIRNETDILNLKIRKIHVPLGYLTLFFKEVKNNNEKGKGDERGC